MLRASLASNMLRTMRNARILYSHFDLVAVELRLGGRLVDDAGKVGGLVSKCNHGMMPDARMVLNRLFGRSQEHAQRIQIWPVICQIKAKQDPKERRKEIGRREQGTETEGRFVMVSNVVISLVL